MGYTDWHCHLLPQLDDGAGDPEEALAMARALASAGFSRVVCTPHFLPGGYANTPDGVRDATTSLQSLLRREGVELELHAAGEYYLDEFLHLRLAEPLAAPGRRLLAEFPPHLGAQLLPRLVDAVSSKGIVPLIAHPERNPLLAPPERRRGLLARFLAKEESPVLEQLRERGCLFQGNIGSFAGLYGEKVRSRALALLEEGWYDCLGSDAHRSRGLERWLNEGLAAVERVAGSEGLRRLLVVP
ncbi:MAG TPA: CpsB/CapC family capsule biosynthesis tyrosine phosphatase [Verrucomicrobiae bacterium]|nr:CpsB/CapC family capsule biosynthesis tyrosine phosphatase [Verrucomicrobiae bacterium]